MMAASGLEVLFLMLFMTPGSDLMSLIDPADYFKSRNVAVSVDKMVELATAAPKDVKGETAQLLALRYLADEADAVKKDKNFAAILKKIEALAEGQGDQDKLGFVAAHARQTAIRLGSKLEPQVPQAPKDSLTKDAVAWFPKSASLVMGADFRHTALTADKGYVEQRGKLVKMLPAIFKEQIYKAADELGNVRIDRMAMAYHDDPQNAGDSKFFIRLTGKFDHKRAVAFLGKTLPGGWKLKESKTFRKQVIAQFTNPNEEGAVALIGDQDFVIAFHDRAAKKDGPALLEEMLDVVRGKSDGVLAGPLAAKLKHVSPKAAGLVVGELPAEMRKNAVGGPQPEFKSFPKDVVIEMHQKGNDLHFKMTADLASADEAKDFVTSADALVQKGIAGLQNPPPFPPNFPNVDKLLKGAMDTLKSIKVEAKGKSVTGSMKVGQDLINGYLGISGFFVGELRGAPRPRQARASMPSRLGNARPAALRLAPLTLDRFPVACRHGCT